MSTILVPVCESICKSLWCVIVCDCSCVCVCACACACVHVCVCVSPLEVPRGFMDMLSEHLMLIYTGRTRLARNVLQVNSTQYRVHEIKRGWLYYV